jgi:hypothetical protein
VVFIPGWTFNDDLNNPTFKPSILVRGGHFAPEWNGETCWCTYNAEQIAKGEEPSGFKCKQCHSYVTEGNIEFLSDCSHELAGQTVPLPELKQEED